MKNHRTKYSKNNILATEYQVLDEVRDKCSKDWFDRVYLCYEDTNFTPANTYTTIKCCYFHQYNSL